MAPDILVTLPDSRHIKLAFAINILLRNLHVMHGIWRNKALLTEYQVGQYDAAVRTFGLVWSALKWKGTVWVHWVVRHSMFFISKYREGGPFEHS